MAVRYYSSVAPPTTLSGSISAGAASITVGSTTGFPALTPYTLSLSYDTIGEELVQVNSVGGTTLGVTRGIDGTSATSHNAGVEVRHVTSARDFADSRTHEESDGGVHGLGPGEELVGTTKVQTLSNKTLDMADGTLNRITIFNDSDWTTTINGDAAFPNTNLLELKADPSGDTALTVGAGGILRVFNTLANDSAPTNLKFRLIRNDGTTDIVTIAAGGNITTRLNDGTDGVIVQGSADNVRRRAFFTRDLDGSTVRSALYTDGTQFLSSKAPAQPTLDIRTASAQTARALRIQNSAMTEVAYFTPSGDLTVPELNTTDINGRAYPRIASGTATFNFSSDTQSDITVTFPGGLFTSQPRVTMTLRGLPGTSSSLIVRTNDVLTTEFKARCNDVNATPRTLTINADWIAVQT